MRTFLTSLVITAIVAMNVFYITHNLDASSTAWPWYVRALIGLAGTLIIFGTYVVAFLEIDHRETERKAKEFYRRGGHLG